MAEHSACLQPPPAVLTNPRFTLELEFVLSLANPYYLSHLAVNYPSLLGTSSSQEPSSDGSDGSDVSASASSDAQAFASYLAYLYSYWKTPEYAQFLTHPGATLRALRLLQEESFRRDIIRPQVIESLLGLGPGDQGGGITQPGDEQQKAVTGEPADASNGVNA
jgi:mediator of RNA polymerase II transcription subunit 31